MSHSISSSLSELLASQDGKDLERRETEGRVDEDRDSQAKILVGLVIMHRIICPWQHG